MTERERLIELIHMGIEYARGQMQDEGVDFAYADVADHLLANGVIVPPVKIGQTVYKICPKCNEHHNGSCERCAWRGCIDGCDIGVRVYSDGSHNEHELQIVPRMVGEHNIVTVFKLWNIMYFATEEEANAAKAEYDAIRKIEDRKKRYETYKEWHTKRETHYQFLERSEGK